MNYILSPAIMFDADEELYFTKIGTDCKGKPLKFTVWGISEEDCRIKAENLVTKLNGVNQPGNMHDLTGNVNYVASLADGKLLVELTDTEAVPPFVMVNNTVYVPKPENLAETSSILVRTIQKLQANLKQVQKQKTNVLDCLTKLHSFVRHGDPLTPNFIYSVEQTIENNKYSPKHDATAPNLANNAEVSQMPITSQSTQDAPVWSEIHNILLDEVSGGYNGLVDGRGEAANLIAGLFQGYYSTLEAKIKALEEQIQLEKDEAIKSINQAERLYAELQQEFKEYRQDEKGGYFHQY